MPQAGSAVVIAAALASPVFATPHQRPDVAIHRDTRSELASVHLAAAVSVAQARADGPDGLPATWCGDETAGEGTANAAAPRAAAELKVVYAYAADRPDRFAGFKDALQADVAVTERFLSAQSGGTKALRFDMGTRCGPQYADLRVVALPGPRAAYAGNFGAITTAVGNPIGDYVGTARHRDPGRQPLTLRCRVWARRDVHGGGRRAARGGWWPEGFLHEITHNLGAVQWDAPHSTAPATGLDRTPYGSGAAHVMQNDCATFSGTIDQTYDCGRDDYYNPAPPAGSYLATHWNTYDSDFMATCATIAPACGGGELWTPAPPVATTAPSIGGHPRRGATLQSSDGIWLNQPGSYTRTWQRLSRNRWVTVSRALAARYVPTMQDLGHRLRVVVAAENADGTTASTSPPTAPIAAIAITRAATVKHRSHR